MDITKFVPHVVTRKVGRAFLHAKKDSPHVFFAIGIVGVVGSTVLACRATLKLDKTLDEIKRDLDDVREMSHPSVTQMHGADETGYTQREYLKDLGYAYAKGFVKLGKLYAPSIVIGTASIGSLTGSHVQMTRRNSGLTMALATVSQAYENYRERVREEFGEEKERDIYYGLRDEKVSVDGNSRKETVKVKDPNHWSPYSRMFDETCINWQKDEELNRIFIQCQQNYFNHRLKAIGHVFLNEVYDALGFERTRAGALMGWLADGDGDCYVDFGMFEAFNSRFVNNIERSVMLDFNVDNGTIYDKI